MNEEFMKNSIWAYPSETFTKKNNKTISFYIRYYIRKRNKWNFLSNIAILLAFVTVALQTSFVTMLKNSTTDGQPFLFGGAIIFIAVFLVVLWLIFSFKRDNVGNELAKHFREEYSSAGIDLDEEEYTQLSSFLFNVMGEGKTSSHAFKTNKNENYTLIVNWEERSLTAKPTKNGHNLPEKNNTTTFEKEAQTSESSKIKENCFQLVNMVTAKEKNFVESLATLSAKADSVAKFELNVEEQHVLERVSCDLEELVAIAKNLKTVDQLKENLKKLTSAVTMLSEEITILETAKTEAATRFLNTKLAFIEDRSHKNLFNLSARKEILNDK